MSEALIILVLAIWGIILIYQSIVDDWVSFYLLGAAFLLSLYFVEGIISWFNGLEGVSWIGPIIFIIRTAEILIGVILLYKFCSLIIN